MCESKARNRSSGVGSADEPSGMPSRRSVAVKLLLLSLHQRLATRRPAWTANTASEPEANGELQVRLKVVQSALRETQRGGYPTDRWRRSWTATISCSRVSNSRRRYFGRYARLCAPGWLKRPATKGRKTFNQRVSIRRRENEAGGIPREVRVKG